MRNTDTGRELYSCVICMGTVLLDCKDLCDSNRYYNILQIIYLLIYLFGEALIYLWMYNVWYCCASASGTTCFVLYGGVHKSAILRL